MPDITGLTYADPGAAAANAKRCQGFLDSGGPVGMPADTRKLWVGPVAVTSHRRTHFVGWGSRVVSELAVGKVWLAVLDVAEHKVEGFDWSGTGGRDQGTGGYFAQVPSKVKVDECHASDAQGAVWFVDDKAVVERVTGKNLVDFLWVAPPLDSKGKVKHAGGQRVRDCRADECGSFVGMAPMARMESWDLVDSTASQCGWMVRRLAPAPDAPLFMVGNVWTQVGAEFLHDGTFYDPSPRGQIVGNVFTGQVPTLQGNTPATDTLKVSACRDNDLHRSEWVPAG